MPAKPKPAIRSGQERGDRRRTLIDDRSGIVADIAQSGPEDEPCLYIELYPWGSGYEAHVQLVTERRHPYIVVTRYKAEPAAD